MKKIAMILAVVLVLSLCLAGCDNAQAKLEALTGAWVMTERDTEEQARVLLEGIDLYEEELAFVGKNTLDYIKRVEFTADKTFRFVVDKEGTWQCVRDFYAGVFDTLYENRTGLNDVYGVDFGAMDRAAFNKFYADLYEQPDFETMLDVFAGNAYNYDSFDVPLTSGTFLIMGDQLLCTPTGESEASTLAYSVSGDQLTLTYSDAVEVYRKAQ